MVAKHVNKKNAGKPSVFAINALLHSLAALSLLQPSVLWLSIVTFNNDVKLSHRPSEFCANLMYYASFPG